MKRFLILQLRPERAASDAELAAILAKSGLDAARAHRIRLDAEALPAALDPADYAGTVVGGGPGCVSDAPEEKTADHARIEGAVMSLMPRITGGDLPFLGCCYGIGILGKHLNGTVAKGRYGEPVGTADCTLTAEGRNDPLLAGVPDRFDAFVGHKEALKELPRGCAHLVAAPTCPFQMVRHGDNVYATQFHPEADADVFEERIRIYRHHGYFPPETAADLVAMCRAAQVHAPELILRNFVRRYG